MGVEVVGTTLGGSNLLGSLVVANSNGVLITDFAFSDELEKLQEFGPVEKLEDKLNAVGNNILVNDKKALVHPGYKKSNSFP